MKSLKYILILCFGFFVTLSACSNEGYEDEMETDDPAMTETDSANMNQHGVMADKAVAVVHPAEGNDVEGWVTFTKEGDGVRVHAELSGLGEGLHGFHIHQYGDCRDIATTPGGHLNPNNAEHGSRTDSTRHLGDMGNIEIGADGTGTLDYLDTMKTLPAIVGRAVIVHQNEDTFVQPTGSAGPQIACGVIGVANPDTSMTGNMENNDM